MCMPELLIKEYTMKNSLKLSRYFPNRYCIDVAQNGLSCPEKSVSMCAGCGCQILDKFILKVAPDMEWHASCLKCNECGKYLDENTTCFVRDGKTYCKMDYTRLFTSKCSKCHQNFTRNDFVMRAKYKIYHTECFRCDICDKLLLPGDEYSLKENEIYCRADHDQLEKTNRYQIENISNSPARTNDCGESKNGKNHSLSAIVPSTINSANNASSSTVHRPPQTSSSSSTSSSSTITTTTNNGGNNGNHSQRKDKTTRMRTVLNEKQLLTLRTCYGANPRPDALMKEQLVEMTQLSPRVIRVWFQNKRCKDKKKSILAKQTQEQQKVLTSLGHGIPLIASSPVHNDMSIGLPPPTLVEFNINGGPWKTVSDAFTLNGPPHDFNGIVPTSTYDSLMSFPSDDESCFDTSQYSDHGSDDSRSGLHDGRLTQI